LNRRQQRQQADALPLRQPAAGKAPKSQSQHERGDDDRNRLGVDAEDAEQLSLPGQLIDQRRKSRAKEKRAEDFDPCREGRLGTNQRQLKDRHWASRKTSTLTIVREA